MEKLSAEMEKELLVGIRHHDAHAYERLFNRYWEELYAQAYRRLHDHGEAEDLVQDVFADIWQRRESLEIKGSFANYLRTAMKYRIIKWASRADIKKAAVDHLLRRMDEMEDTILSAISAKEISKTMAEVLDSFPENMRRVFLLRAEEHSVAEIAEALGLAEQTIKNTSAEAFRRVKSTLYQKHPHLNKSFYILLLLLLTES